MACKLKQSFSLLKETDTPNIEKNSGEQISELEKINWILNAVKEAQENANKVLTVEVNFRKEKKQRTEKASK